MRIALAIGNIFGTRHANSRGGGGPRPFTLASERIARATLQKTGDTDMNKFIAAAVAAGALGAGLAFAAPASAAPNCSDVVDKINNGVDGEDYTPTTTEKWTCAVDIQANKWATFPGNLADKWAGFPGRTAQKWADFPGDTADKWASFPGDTADKWGSFPGDLAKKWGVGGGEDDDSE